MSELLEVRVPDVGGVDAIDVMELLVAPGDRVEKDQGLLVLATDKASMDLPSPVAGTVKELKVAVGDKVAEGGLILLLEVAEAGAKPAAPPLATPAPAPSPSPSSDSGDPAELSTRLLVLGSGPGGYTAAFRAADLGLEVTLVERYPSLGGVCLNVGCIPSKALLHAGEVIAAAARMGGHGITFGEPKIDLDRLRGWKDEVVGRLTGGIAFMAKKRGVRVIRGIGTLVGPHELEIIPTDDQGAPVNGSPRRLRFEQAILAAGSRVTKIPSLDLDDPRVIDSTGALALGEIPPRLLIVGGGIIGLEMACVYLALGSRVTVVELMDRLIPEADKDLVKPLAKQLAERCEAIHLKTMVTGLTPREKGLLATFAAAAGSGEEPPEAATFDRVLVAVGRRPNGDRIGAEAAGLTVTERGFVPVDRQLRTNVPHLFAIGDLAQPPMLAHKAVHEGKVAAEVAAGLKSSFDARVIPSVAYTDPEVAWVGLTEREAKEKGIDYERGTFPWSASGRSLALGREDGATKLLIDPATERILGAGIVGPHAGDLIAEAALAIEMGCEARDLALTIHPHPTLSETLGLAAEDFEGTLTDLYKPRKRKGK